MSLDTISSFDNFEEGLAIHQQGSLESRLNTHMSIGSSPLQLNCNGSK
jgi:hypothetical protein